MSRCNLGLLFTISHRIPITHYIPNIFPLYLRYCWLTPFLLAKKMKITMLRQTQSYILWLLMDIPRYTPLNPLAYPPVTGYMVC